MSFINYNFFPILFFLGWNILTTKQFSPTIPNTSNFKILPGLSVFSLTNSKLFGDDLYSTNLENKERVRILGTKTQRSAGDPHEKKINIVEFVSKFQFLGENKKLIPKKTNSIKPITKLIEWGNLPLTNKRSKYYYTNHNLVNNNWKINFKSNFFDFSGINTKKFNSINLRQKRRLKIQSLLRIPTQTSVIWPSLNHRRVDHIQTRNGQALPRVSHLSKRLTSTQKIYSLNKFQIALCFSKILRPCIFAKNNYNFSLPPKIYNPVFHDSQASVLWDLPNHERLDIFPDSKNINDRFREASASVEQQKVPYNYNLRKKNWYMKTQFFQHIAWNMKHNILRPLSDVEYLWHNTSLAIKNSDNFVRPHLSFHTCVSDKEKDARESEKASYQKKQHFSTDLAKGLKSTQNSNLIIYGGSWYYENLAFSYNIFNVLPLTSTAPLSAKLNSRLKSDIGIYSLAHKLSSVGFHNGNSEIDIYPFKYNDSYRYNFQNMNLSNQHLQSFLTGYSLVAPQSVKRQRVPEQDFISLSDLKNKTRNESVWTGNQLKNMEASNNSNFSNFRKFLNFQNPTFSKIYAPLFQPQGLNLLSFI